MRTEPEANRNKSIRQVQGSGVMLQQSKVSETWEDKISEQNVNQKLSLW